MQLKTRDVIDIYATEADEYFKNYIPYVMKRIKEWINNNCAYGFYHYEINYIKKDGLSFAYEHYEELKNNRFKNDVNSARKYWIKTVWLKLLDYLNYNYLNIDIHNKSDPYKRNYLVSLDSFVHEDSDFLYEKVLSSYHSPSPEFLLIEQEEQNLPNILYEMVKDFVSEQYKMHNYSIPKQVYVAMIQDCLDSAVNTLRNRTSSCNDRAANIRHVSEKHNVPYKNVNMYYARFKEDVRDYLWFIPIYLREKNTPKKL